MARKKSIWTVISLVVGAGFGLYLLFKALSKSINTASSNVGRSLGQEFGRQVSLAPGIVADKAGNFLTGLESQAINYVGSKAIGFIGKLLKPTAGGVALPDTTFSIDYTGDVTYPGIDTLSDYGKATDPASTAAYKDAYDSMYA